LGATDIKCNRCGNPVPLARRECQACGEDNGFPNVRLANLTGERAVLSRRLDSAQVSTTARRCKDILDRFGVAVLASHAVVARSLAVVQDLIESDRRSYTNYHRQLAQGARVAEDNEFDQVRTQFEAALFPNFHHEMLFACLSLDGRGVSGYGAYTIVLKQEMIGHRASVFEENPLVFCRKHKVLLNEPIPPGYRADWPNRHLLAMAKLHSEITPATKDAEFRDILLKERPGTSESDFIEVHIFGTINRYSIERVVGPTPRTREDRLIWKRLDRSLRAIGATMEAL
jgi:hypothetical protein